LNLLFLPSLPLSYLWEISFLPFAFGEEKTACDLGGGETGDQGGGVIDRDQSGGDTDGVLLRSASDLIPLEEDDEELQIHLPVDF